MITWDSSLEIGVESVDQEHRSIIEEFSKLYNLMKGGGGHEYYNDLIKFLENYVTDHFDHEEELQREIQYPKFVEHVEHHEAFKKEVQRIKKEHEGVEINNIDLIKLNLFIKDWLVNHILTVDKELGEYYKANIGK